MREMVFRERTEKVAHVRAFAEIVARVFNVDVERQFGGIISEYASEVFQESYDSTILQRKREALREAQRRIRAKREADLRSIDRLKRMEKLGETFEARTNALRDRSK